MKRKKFNLLGILLLVAASVCAAQQPNDPMRPSYVKAVRAASRQSHPLFVLQAVMGTEQQRLAVVSGRVVEVGDDVLGAVVSRIGSASVELRTRTRRWTIRLPNAVIGER